MKQTVVFGTTSPSKCRGMAQLAAPPHTAVLHNSLAVLSSNPHLPVPMQTKTKIGWFLTLVLLSLATTAEAATLLTYRSAGWKYVLGTAEASNPTDAWRALGFDDSAWTPGAAPVGYPSADGGPLEL